MTFTRERLTTLLNVALEMAHIGRDSMPGVLTSWKPAIAAIEAALASLTNDEEFNRPGCDHVDRVAKELQHVASSSDEVTFGNAGFNTFSGGVSCCYHAMRAAQWFIDVGYAQDNRGHEQIATHHLLLAINAAGKLDKPRADKAARKIGPGDDGAWKVFMTLLGDGCDFNDAYDRAEAVIGR